MHRSLFLLLIFITPFSYAEIQISSDYKDWTKVKTPLTQIGYIPSCEADISQLPEIYQETVYTYCDLKEDGPGRVEVLVKPELVEKYKTRSNDYPDGINFILRLLDMNVFLATGHNDGTPFYKVFTDDLKDITEEFGPLSPETCRACHTGYDGYCIQGQCAKSMD